MINELSTTKAFKDRKLPKREPLFVHPYSIALTAFFLNFKLLVFFRRGSLSSGIKLLKSHSSSTSISKLNILWINIWASRKKVAVFLNQQLSHEEFLRQDERGKIYKTQKNNDNFSSTIAIRNSLSNCCEEGARSRWE